MMRCTVHGLVLITKGDLTPKIFMRNQVIKSSVFSKEMDNLNEFIILFIYELNHEDMKTYLDNPLKYICQNGLEV